MDVASVKGKALLGKTLHLIDLYEQVSAVHYDYPYLRKQLATTKALPLIQQAIELLAKQLLFAKREKTYRLQYNKIIVELKDKTENQSAPQNQLLQQIITNLDEISGLIIGVKNQNPIQANNDKSTDKYYDFLPSAGYFFKNLLRQFSLKSPVFRFALRLSLLCLFAMVSISFFSTSHYSYWLLLTIIIISRPSYGLTIKRNWQRLCGTFLGIILAYGIMLHTDAQLQLALSGIFLFGFFAFNRPAYGASVICITIAVLLCLNVYDGHTWEIVSGRFVFTLLGGLLCLAATFLFPIWSAPRIYDLIKSVLLANSEYFETVVQIKAHDAETLHQSRLARKNSHQQLTALSDAVMAAKKEPFEKKLNWNLIKKFELLSHQFNALTAALAGAHRNNVQVLTNQQLDKIRANLQLTITEADAIELNQQNPTPNWGEQPMDIIEVVKRIKQLLSSP